MRSIRSFILSCCLLKTVAVAALLFSASNSFAVPSEPVNNRNILRVVMDDNYPPYVFKGDQGQLKGIIIDQWGLWEKKTGIHVEITGMDWGEAQRKMQAGKFDVIDTIFRNENREKIYDFTKPYAFIPVPLFFHTDISGISGPKDAIGFMVAAKAGGNVLEVLRNNGITNIVEYPSFEKIIEAARDGKVKVFTVDRPPALYFLNRMGIQEKFHETKPIYTGEFHRAVIKGRSDLLALVQKGFADITPAEYHAINKKWTGTPISAEPYFSYLCYTAAAMAVFVAGLLVWLRLLKRAVAIKTRKLTESEERLSFALNTSISGTWYWNVKTVKVYFDSNYFTMAGYEPNEFPHSYDEWEKRVHPDDVGGARKAIEAYLAGTAGSCDAEFRFKRKDDTWMWIRSQGRLFGRDKQGRPLRFIGMHTDITESKAAEEALKESEELFHQLFIQNWDGAMLLHQETFNVVDANPVLLSLFGYGLAEMQQPNPWPLIVPGSADRFMKLLRDASLLGEAFLEKGYCRSKDGKEIIVSIKAKLIHFKKENLLYCSIRDISDRVRLQEEKAEARSKLIHANKMTSLGLLVSGIAHEINNPNQYLSMNASVLAGVWEDSAKILSRYRDEHGEFMLKGMSFTQALEKMPRLLIGITEGSQRINLIVNNLKDFARDDRCLSPSTFDVNKAIQASLQILSHHIHRHTYNFQLELDTNIPCVKGKAQQIEQVIINLITNALQALSDKTQFVRLTTSYEPTTDSVVVSVGDQGKGMTQEVLERITEPFFSTNLDKGGTGLGLSISATILKDHDGTLEFASEPDVGTTATIRLPAARTNL